MSTIQSWFGLPARKGSYAVLLFLVSILLYIPTLQYAFSPLDEKWLILDNVRLFSSENALSQIFHSNIQEIFYRPLLLASFLVDYWLGGSDPFFYHLSNVILHGLSVVLLYQLFRTMETGPDQAFLWTLIFAVHPLALHAVAWVPGRNDSLLFIFLSLSLICLLNEKPIYLILHFLFFMCAILTKESAVLFPLIYLAFMRTRAYTRKRYISATFLWLLAITGWSYLRQQSLNGASSALSLSLTSMWETAMAILVYTGKLIIPVGQSVTPTLRNTSYFAVIAGLIILIVILIQKYPREKKRVFVATLSLFVIPLLVPVFFSTQQQPAILYEHRAYSSFAGLLIFISLHIDPLKNRLKLAVTLTAAAVYSVFTIVRMPVYTSAESYISEAVEDCPENYVHHYHLGNILFERRDLPGAVRAFSKAQEIHPNRAQVLNNRGTAYYMMKKYDKAIADYSLAYEKSGDKMVLLSRCAAYLYSGDIESSVKDYEVLKNCCAHLIPADLEASIHTAYSDYRYAELNRLIALYPDRGILYVNRAKYWLELRKGDEALADLRKACSLEPDNAHFRRYLTELESSYPR